MIYIASIDNLAKRIADENTPVPAGYGEGYRCVGDLVGGCFDGVEALGGQPA
jgi:hypothetical protein